jgi:hypothetical protein
MITVKKILAVLAAALAATASAQNHQTGSNTGQATMRIQVVVVPTVTTSQSIVPKNGLAVTYSIPINPPQMTTREEIHFTPSPSGKGQPIVVRTITIVPE